MPIWSNKLSEFEDIRTEPTKLNTLESSRVSRTRGIACSVNFEQPLRACFVLRTAQCLCYIHYIRPLHPLIIGPKISSSNSTGKEKIKVVRTTIELKKEIPILPNRCRPLRGWKTRPEKERRGRPNRHHSIPAPRERGLIQPFFR